MTAETDTNVRKFLESGYSLPALSVVAIKLVELASDDRCSVSDLVGLIEKEPSLAVRLIKLANSAFFKTGQPVTTLREAIVRLGFHQVRIMALSLSLRDTFPMGKVGSFDYEGFWRASLYRASLAQSFALHLRNCNPEEAFVGGLTLEIGALLFFDLFLKGTQHEMNLGLNSLEDLLAWEKEHYGMHHREIGETALRYWKFPEEIVNCQRCYGDPSIAEPLPKVCEWSRVLSVMLLQGERDFHALFRDAEVLFGIDHQILSNIIIATFEQVEDVAKSLRIEMNREKDLLELMERANKALSKISEQISMWGSQLSEHISPSFESLEHAEDQVSVNRTLEAVAHEIRNPLVAVAGFAKRLSATLDPSSRGGKYAEIILQEALRLETALNRMNPLNPHIRENL